MLARLTSALRRRWHPLFHLRQLAAFRRLQRFCDFTVYARIPETDLRVAVKLLRDASWIVNPASLEPEIRAAFALVLELDQPATFWDIGANIGFYSWLVRKHPAVRDVMMFEPDPTNFGLISRTIGRNSISNCEVMQVALSDEAGEAAFIVDQVSGAAGSLAATPHLKNTVSLQHLYQMSATISCRTATIDGLVGEGVPPPQFIKIDVEGAEHLVLKGARSTLALHRPTMIIETYNVDLVLSFLPEGYTAFRIDQGDILLSAATGASLARLERVFAQIPQGGTGGRGFAPISAACGQDPGGSVSQEVQR